jgi:hypothetical protein
VLLKADINYVTILGQKLWHATLIDSFQEIGSPDFLPEHWRKGSVIYQPVVEPVNRVSSPSESTFIELTSELLQSMGITQAFL